MRALLEAQGIEVVGGAGSADEARQQIAELRPDVALIDIDLGGESGLALARSVHDGATDAVPEVILISTHDESEFADLIEATSSGWLPLEDRALGGDDPPDARDLAGSEPRRA